MKAILITVLHLVRDVTVFEFVRSSPLFGVRRLVFALVLAVCIVATDVFFVRFKDLQTTADVAGEVAVLTLGLYGGFTIMALFNQAPDWIN